MQTEQNYQRLENELQELKKAFMGRYQSQDPLQDTTQRRSNRIDEQPEQLYRSSNPTKDTKKARFDLTYDPSDDERDAAKGLGAGATTRREGKEAKDSKDATVPKKSSLRSAVSPSNRSRSVKRKSKERANQSVIQGATSPKNIDYLTSMRTERSMKELNKTIQEREKVQHEKYVNLKLKYKELKGFSKEIVDKNHKLQDLLNKKDAQILELEDQIRRDQEELYRNVEFIKENKLRFDELARQEEEERTQNIEYKTRLSDQKEQFDKIEEVVRDNENRYRRELGKLSQEVAELKTELALVGEREAGLKNRNTILAGDLEDSLKEIDRLKRVNDKFEDGGKLMEREVQNLKDNLEKLLNENRDLTQKLEDSNISFATLEQKYDRQRKNFDSERERMHDDRDKELNAKKERIKALKDQVREQEILLNKAIMDKKDQNNEIDKLINDKKALEKDNASLQEEVEFAAKEG